MAEITVLEEKLAEVLGLAQAAQAATDKIGGMTDDEEIASHLKRMHDEAAETEERCTAIADDLDGKKTAVLEKARATKQEAQEMMSTYLGSDAEALDGFEFLTMAEAGEVGHWRVLGKLGEKAGRSEITELCSWALPIQQRHFETVQEDALRLAAEEDPDSTA